MSFPGAPGHTPVVTTAQGFAPPPAYIPKPGGFQTASNLQPRWDANINFFDFPPGTFVRMRFVGPVTKIYQHWLKSQKGQKNFPQFCVDWDIAGQKWKDQHTCPVEKNLDLENVHKEQKARFSGLAHAIIKDFPNPGAAYLMAVRVPAQVMITLEKIAQINIHVIEGTTYKVDVTDPYYGMDVFVLYDPKQTNNKYNVQQTNQGSQPLTQSEMGFMTQLYNWGEIIVPQTFQELERALKQNGYLGAVDAPAAGVLPGLPVPPTYTVGAGASQSFGGPPVVNVGPPQVPAGYAPPQAPVAYQPQPPQAPVTYQPQPPQQPYMPPQPPMQQMAPPGAHILSGPAPAPMPMGMPTPMPTMATAIQPALQASVPPAPMPLNQVAPMSQPAPVAAAPQADPGSRSFLVMGKGQVDATTFQNEIISYAGRLARGQPMKFSGGGEIEGFQVLACFGSYKGDGECIRCPIRKYCLDAKP